MFPSIVSRKMAGIPGNDALCNAFTADTIKTELSDERKMPELHADGAHGETEMSDEMELKMRCNGDPNTWCRGNQSRDAAVTQTRCTTATKTRGALATQTCRVVLLKHEVQRQPKHEVQRRPKHEVQVQSKQEVQR